jgi:hypothetical protein
MSLIMIGVKTSRDPRLELRSLILNRERHERPGCSIAYLYFPTLFLTLIKMAKDEIDLVMFEILMLLNSLSMKKQKSIFSY